MPARLPPQVAAPLLRAGLAPTSNLRVYQHNRLSGAALARLSPLATLDSRAQQRSISKTPARFYARPHWRTPEFASTVKSPIKPRNDNDLFDDGEVIYETPDGGKALVKKTKSGPKLQIVYPTGTPMLRPGRPWSNHDRFLAANYLKMLRSPATLLFQAVGAPSKLLNGTRNEMAMQGLSLKMVDNRVFKMTVQSTRYAGLAKVLAGTTVVCYWDPDFEARGPTPDEGFEAYEEHRRNNPPGEAELMRQITAITAKNPFLTLLGGRIKSGLLTAGDVLNIIALPPIGQVRGELLGTVEMAARNVIGTVAQPSQALARALDTHSENVRTGKGEIEEVQK